MAKQSNSLKKLEYALFETHQALGELLQAIKETSSVRRVNKLKKSSRHEKFNRIIPYYVFEAYQERRQRGEQLDQRYRQLWLEEQKLLSAYLDPYNADEHDILVAELEAVRQQMTEIEQEFDPPDNEA
jgi:hypothetical protein